MLHNTSIYTKKTFQSILDAILTMNCTQLSRETRYSEKELCVFPLTAPPSSFTPARAQACSFCSQ